MMDIPENMRAKLDAQDNLAGGVYLVMVHDRNVFKQHAIFSTFERARSWMSELPNHLTCFCAPFVIDVPDIEMRNGLVN